MIILFMFAVGVAGVGTALILGAVSLACKMLGRANPFSPNLFWSND